MKLTMYMVTHKDVDFIPKGRTPILVGNSISTKNFLRDNTGDNISCKNACFCELTAMYWIWKNDKDSDFVAIEHYRRFFANPNFPFSVVSNERLKKILGNGECAITRALSLSLS